MVTLGSISIDLVANTVSFAQGMTKASALSLSTSKNIQRSFNMIAVEATAMGSAVAGALEEMIRHAEDYAFSIQKAASATGSSTEQFSKLAYSAKLAGTPMDVLKMAMERLARTSGAAQSGNKQAVQAYAALGVSVKDLNGPLSNTGDLIVSLAKKFDNLKDSENKTALEQKLFGRSGAELNPLFTQLASGFDTASEQATLFGIVVGDKTAAQARQLHQSLIQLESISLGFSLRLLSGVAPALEEVSKKIIDVVTSSDGMKTIDSIASSVATVITGLGNAFVFVAQHATEFKDALLAISLFKVSSIIAPMITSFGGLSVAIKAATKAMFGFQVASVSALVPLLAPTALVAGAILTIVSVLNLVKDNAQASTKAAVQWGDIWTGAIHQVTFALGQMRAFFDYNLGIEDEQDKAIANEMKQYGLLGKSISEVAKEAANARVERGKLNGFLHAGDLESAADKAGKTKADAPTLPTIQKEKLDVVAKKITDLRDAAVAATRAVADIGKGVDAELADKAFKESKKTIDDLSIVLKAQLKPALTEVEKQNIRNATAITIYKDAQFEYLKTIQKSTEELTAQAQAQDILTAAIGKGAEAQLQAQVAADALKRNAGKSESFQRNDGGANFALDKAQRDALTAANASSDRTALQGVQEQINAQTNLNDAIFKTLGARQATALEAEQAAIRLDFAKRGDTNSGAEQAALDANAKLFNLKVQQADREAAASKVSLRNYEEQIQEINRVAAAAQAAGNALSTMQINAAKLDAWRAYNAAVDQATLAVGGLSDGVSVFFREMTVNAKSAAQQVHDVLSQAFESVNSMFERLVTGQKVQVADLFKGLAGSLAKMGIQKLETTVAGNFGKFLGLDGGNQNPVVNKLSETNAILRQGFAQAMSGSGGGSGIASSLGDGAGGGAGGGLLQAGLGMLTSLIPGGGIISGLLGGFGGHLALGGYAQAGMTYDVGEMGRERFTPTQDGYITPHNKMGGDIHYHIDARGSNDPAATEAAINRAFAVNTPKILAASQRTSNQMRKRAPSVH